LPVPFLLGVDLMLSTWLICPPTDPLNPMIPDNAWILRITAAVWLTLQYFWFY
jgi:hypothetical protein